MIATTISGHRTSIETKVNSYKAANYIDKLLYACAHVRGSKQGVTVAHRDIFDKMASTISFAFTECGSWTDLFHGTFADVVTTSCVVADGRTVGVRGSAAVTSPPVIIIIAS